MIDLVFLPTIQHTGTWFAIDVLQKFGYTNFIEYRHNTPGFDICQVPINSIVHAHFPSSENVLEEEEYKFIPAEIIPTIYDTLKNRCNCLLVIPIRDVLSALITRYGRHPNQTHKYIVDGFLAMAKDIDKLEPFYFPVDLDKPKQERLSFLISLERQLKKVMSYKETIAFEWSPKNTQGLYPLKEAHLQRNARFIRETIPEDWAYLMENRYVLQPYFEKLGYTDLLWFKENDNG